MKEILVITGITGTGKSDVALRLAKAYNAEIVSADSVAVYKELTIGSAKPTEEAMREVVHHLVNQQSYDEPYDVALFQKEARAAIQAIQSRGKNVIVVGGTGFYLKALLYDYRFDEEVKELDVNYESMDAKKRYELLIQRDPEIAKKLHINNEKRVVRALIAFDQHNKAQHERTEMQKNHQIIPARLLFLTGPRETMYQRMNERVDKMMEAGLVEEVRALLEKDADLFSKRSMQAIGYREFEEYFLGNQTLTETVEQIKRDTRRFAKRQWTWFKHQMTVEIIDVTQGEVFEIIRKHYEK